MTFTEFYDALIAQGCNYHNADNIVGRIMDDLDLYEWDATVPAEIVALHL